MFRFRNNRIYENKIMCLSLKWHRNNHNRIMKIIKSCSYCRKGFETNTHLWIAQIMRTVSREVLIPDKCWGGGQPWRCVAIKWSTPLLTLLTKIGKLHSSALVWYRVLHRFVPFSLALPWIGNMFQVFCFSSIILNNCAYFPIFRTYPNTSK